MSKHLHAIEFDGTTFGMEIETNTIAYKNFKKSVKYEECISIFGDKIQEFTIPYLMLGAIMEQAHWLVTENMSFDCIQIDGFRNGEKIYVKYSNEMINFRNRQVFRKESNKNICV